MITTDKIIKCRKTERRYNPEQEIKNLFNQKWFLDIMKRLADK